MNKEARLDATLTNALPIFASISGLTATAQVLPTSSGSCVVSASGGGCNWASTIRIRKTETSTTNEVSDRAERQLFLTVFRLAPGTPLDSRAIVGGEVLIVGRNSGKVINEKKSPSKHIDVYDGLVMLMPKGEPYLLRNVGKDYVDLLVIEIRERAPKPHSSSGPGR